MFYIILILVNVISSYVSVSQFNDAGELSEQSPYYNDSPTINDKVHILVCVIDANTDEAKNAHVIKILQDIRLEASKLGEKLDYNVYFSQWG